MKIQINSTAIKEVEYNTETATLVVNFTDGKTCDYLNVLNETFDEFIKAQSKGRYFNLYIRNNFEVIQR